MDRLSKNLRPCQAQDLLQYELEKELTLYHPRAEVVHILNPTAAVIWRLCDGTLEVEDIAALMELEPEEPMAITVPTPAAQGRSTLARRPWRETGIAVASKA